MDEQIAWREVSCYCQGCRSGTGCDAPAGTIPPMKEKEMHEIRNQAADNQVAAQQLLAAAWKIIDEADVGDMLGIYVPQMNRAGHNEQDRDLWGAGRFMVVELAKVPDVEERKRTGTRMRGGPKVKVFMPEEVDKERRYRFPSGEVCHNGGLPLVSRGDHMGCDKKHYIEIDVGCVRGGPWSMKEVACINSERGDQEPVRRSGRRLSRGEQALRRVLIRARGGGEDGAADSEVDFTLKDGVVQILTQIDEGNRRKYRSALTA